MQEKSLFWFRRDLRLNDNNGLYQALKSGRNVVCFYIFDPKLLANLEKNDRKANFIYRSVMSLKKKLESHGSSLDIRFGDPISVFPHLIRDYEFKTLFFNHDYDPVTIHSDENISRLLNLHGVKVKTFKDHVIFEKKELMANRSLPFLDFESYARKWKESINFNQVSQYKSESKLNRLNQMNPISSPTLEEMGFVKKSYIFDEPVFNEISLRKYKYTKDYPALKDGTSKLGPHLRFGTVSIRECVNFSLLHSEAFLNELIRRDFFAQSIYNFPHTVNAPFKKNYDRIEWNNDPELFKKWTEGKTGYPLVDAGMRELSETGYINNRVRMIVASFLCKNLRINWTWGDSYFSKNLLDYDVSSSVGNWQSISGGGVDAEPYFRVLNPASQTEKYDFQHFYVKKWVPEYRSMDYVKPIVDFVDSRDICFKMYKKAVIAT